MKMPLQAVAFLSISLTANVMAIETQQEAAAPNTKFVIMSAEEMQQHRAKMAELKGGEREAYRNMQYQVLRERAREAGYILPPMPVWSLPADPRIKELEAIREKQHRTADIHRKEMRKRFDEFMASQQKTSEKPASSTRKPATPATAGGYWPYPYPPPMAGYPPPPPPPGYWYPPR